MIPLCVIRPEPSCAATLAAARAIGLEAHGFPMFSVRPLAWEEPAADSFDALLVGSANVFRHGGTALGALRSLPVYAVGETTAVAARAAGFTVALVGTGGLQTVLDRTPPGSRLLRLAGAERVALTAPAGTVMTERVVYASEPSPMPHALHNLLRSKAVVALHSAEAARHFAAECDRLHLARSPVALVCIGLRVAQAAGPSWGALAVAATPSESALLAKAAELCQTAPED